MAAGRVAYDDGVLRVTRTSPAALAIAGEIDEATRGGLVAALQKIAGISLPWRSISAA